MPIGEARNLGVAATFSEKYGDQVRVVRVATDRSVELCAGTHIPNTSYIYPFRILSEGSVAAGKALYLELLFCLTLLNPHFSYLGTRRIEALAGMSCSKWLMGRDGQMGDLAKEIGVRKWWEYHLWGVSYRLTPRDIKATRDNLAGKIRVLAKQEKENSRSIGRLVDVLATSMRDIESRSVSLQQGKKSSGGRACVTNNSWWTYLFSPDI
jgi:hypothetical protein